MFSVTAKFQSSEFQEFFNLYIADDIMNLWHPCNQARAIFIANFAIFDKPLYGHNPCMALNNVVLPAPFLPISPMHSPFLIVNETDLKIFYFLRQTLRFLMSI